MATEQDAARDRVLTARAAFARELETLEASGRAAVDVPAKIRQSPAKAAAVVGGIAFLLLRGPQRLWSAARRAVFGARAPMPKAMLPKEIEKTLRSLGDDGDKVRGVIERDFAEYAKKSQRDRRRLVSVLALGIARPILARGARAAADYLFTPTPEGYATRLDQVRARAGAKFDVARNASERPAGVAPSGAEDESATGI